MINGENIRLKLAVTVIIAISAGSGISAWLLIGLLCPVSPGQQCDLTNWQSLLLEGIIFAGGLGSFFFYLQTLDNRKTQRVLNLINQTSEEVREHIRQQQQIQDSIRLSSFRSIQGQISNTRQSISRFANTIESYKPQNSPKRSVYLNDQLRRTDVFKWSANSIEQQLAIVRPYIRAELADKIQEAQVQISYLGQAEIDYETPGLFVVGVDDTVENWLGYARSLIDSLERLYTIINEYKP